MDQSDWGTLAPEARRRQVAPDAIIARVERLVS